ncbi:MAG: pantoate--beta-alanine ligase [Enterobacteriaceae bacterium]
MLVIKKIRDIVYLIKKIKLKNKKISFIPTMGNIHKGHISLIKLGKTYSDIVIVSIFVNVIQFESKKDFIRYPRTLNKDINTLKKNLVDIIFCPNEKSMYKNLKDYKTFVNVYKYTDILENKKNKNHFRGVTTILTKLFNIVTPNFVVFGEKDYQQLLIVKKLVKDLNYDIKILSSPIVRDKNGLALSSRNNFLIKEEKDKATEVYKLLKNYSSIIENSKNIEKLNKILKKIRKKLLKKNIKILLLEIKDLYDLSNITKNTKKAIILVVFKIRNIKLIDNIKLNLSF